ncbi:MAG: dethiobiotin synthase [Chromatiales bacterium]
MTRSRPRVGVFVTGTDTGVGKTHVCVALLRGLGAAGVRAAAMKPVASGCRHTPEGLRSDDALQLQDAARVRAAYELVNPYPFLEPIAPHMAASRANTVIDLERITAAAMTLAAQSDGLVIEGIGGWRVPLDDHQTVSELALRLGYPVLLVVGLRLGCINHALLTVEAIRSDAAPLLGWVANGCDAAYEPRQGTIDALSARLDAAPLAVIEHDPAARPQRAVEAVAAVTRTLVNHLGRCESVS